MNDNVDRVAPIDDSTAWFSMPYGVDGQQVGRASRTDHTIGFVTLPGLTDLHTVAAGTSGDAWLLSHQGFVHLLPDGSTSAVPSDLAGPAFELRAGADGNMWFVTTRLVGRLSPAGAITTWPIDGSSSDCTATVSVSATIDGHHGTVLASKSAKAPAGRVVKLGLRLSRAGVKAVRMSGHRGRTSLVTVDTGGERARYRLLIAQ